jgi:hypothetical protein
LPQGEEFEIFANNLKPSSFSNEADLVFNIPFFDPPLVSPHDSALAVPVSVLGLWSMFTEVYVCIIKYVCVFVHA